MIARLREWFWQTRLGLLLSQNSRAFDSAMHAKARLIDKIEVNRETNQAAADRLGKTAKAADADVRLGRAFQELDEDLGRDPHRRQG